MIVRQSTARTILVGPVLDSTGAAKTDEVVASIKVTKNGTVGAADGSATLTHDHAGKYKLALTANDSDTVGVLEISLNSGTNDMPVKACNVVETAIWDALFADGATGLLPANMTQIGGDTQSATDLKDFADAGYDPSTNKVQGVVLVDTMAGTIQTLDALDTEQDIEHDATQAAIAGIGTAGGAAINVDASADNSAGGITGVTSGTTKVGTETGTFANTSNVNLVYHQITHDANDIDWVYQFLTGGGTSVVEARWVGYISGSNDTITFYAWDHVGGSWEAIGTQVGAAFTTNVTKNLTLYSRHRGTSAAELGKVYIRLACTGMTSPILYTDQLFVSFAITSRSVGYSNVGAVSIDTLTGVAGTESFVNGVADNPVSTLADALTIATAVNLRQFEIGNGSSITLASSTQNKVFEGHEWNLALGNQDITSSMFIDANVSGTGTGTLAEFETCEIGTVTLGPSFFHGCGFSGTMTLGAAGDYFFYDCHSSVAGTSTPVFDLATAGANNMSFRRWSGGITLNNISSNDVISIDAVSGGTITLNGADGDVQIRGMCSSIVDNRTGTPTLGKNAVINQTLIATQSSVNTIDGIVDAIKIKTDNLPSDPADQSLVEAAITAATSPLATPAQVNAQVLDVLSVDTFAELVAPPAATSSLKDKITWGFMMLRNKVTQTALERKLFADNGATVVGTESTTDDGTTYTKGESS